MPRIQEVHGRDRVCPELCIQPQQMAARQFWLHSYVVSDGKHFHVTSWFLSHVQTLSKGWKRVTCIVAAFKKVDREQPLTLEATSSNQKHLGRKWCTTISSLNFVSLVSDHYPYVFSGLQTAVHYIAHSMLIHFTYNMKTAEMQWTTW